MRKYYLIAIIIISGNIIIYSQVKEYSYFEIVQLAIQNNLSLKQSKNLLIAAQSDVLQKKMEFLPSVNMAFQTVRTNGRQWSGEQETMVNNTINSSKAGIEFGMDLFQGLNRLYELKKSKYVLKNIQNEYDQYINDIVFLTLNQYFKIALDIELLNVAEKNYEVQRKVYESISELVDAGVRPITELLTQDAQLKSIEVEIIEFQNKIRKDKSYMTKEILLNPGQDFSITPMNLQLDTSLNILPVDSLYAIALNNHLKVKIYENKSQQANLDFLSARAQRYPGLNCSYNYGSFYNSEFRTNNELVSFNNQIFDHNLGSSYMVSMNIPIFNKYAIQNNINISKIKYNNSLLEADNMKLELYLEIQDSYGEYMAVRKKHKAISAKYKATEKSLESKKEMLSVGRINLTEFNIETQNFLNVSYEKTSVEYELIIQKLIIDYYIGILDYNKLNIYEN